MIYGLKAATHSPPIQQSFPLHLECATSEPQLHLRTQCRTELDFALLFCRKFIDDSLQNRGGMQLFDTILKLAKF